MHPGNSGRYIIIDHVELKKYLITIELQPAPASVIAPRKGV